MAEKKAKRFLVTYKDQDVDLSKASSILGISKSKCKEGISFMETDSVPDKDDVLHFENIGVSSIELDDEEHSKLVKKESVLAVEEDIEVHVLELTKEVEQTDLVSNGLGGNVMAKGDSYQDGYDYALMDMFSLILHLGRKGNGHQNGTKARSLPIKPVPIRPEPIMPFPPIISPPIFPRQPIPWNINMVKAPDAWSRGLRGSGVNVAVLDTGIASHPDLVISGGASFVQGVTSYDDGHSHGTHCAGIVGARNNFIGVVGVAPLCRLYAVKVLADSGSGQMSWVIAGLEWCISQKMNVASLSLGASVGPRVAYANAIRKCQDHGITVVAATGNSGHTAFPYVGSPANSYQRSTSKSSPIAVGSINQGGHIAASSSRGGEHSEWNQVTVVAPGVSIRSTVLNGEYGFKSGTSMACPHVAGLAALIYEKFPGISPVNVERKITSTASDMGDAGYNTPFGYGLINCDLATL